MAESKVKKSKTNVLNQPINMSPLPVKKGDGLPSGLSFPEAMMQVIAGKRVTKDEWTDQNIYLVLQNGFLMIVRYGKENRVTPSEGDLLGQDWRVVI